MAGLLLVPLLLYAILLLPVVQTSLVNYVTGEISKDLETQISISRVHLRPFKTLVLDEMIVYDQQHDTLVAIEQVVADIDSVFFKKKKLYFKTLKITNPVINVLRTDSVYNFSFLEKILPDADTSVTKGQWKTSLINLDIADARLGYADAQKDKAISLSELNLSLKDIKHDSMWRFNVSDFNCKSNSKLGIDKLSGEIIVSASQFHLNNGVLNSSNSSVEIDSLTVELNDHKTGLDKINSFYLNLKKSNISAGDITTFTPLKRATQIGLSGLLYGTVNNIKGRNVRLNFGPHSQLNSSFDISGLPNIDETFLYFNVNQLVTTPGDFEMLFSHVKGQALNLPAAVKNLNQINYKGNFTGFLTDIVAYGAFTTDLGRINTDLGLKIDSDNELVFSGSLKTENFNIGELVGSEDNLGDVSMSVSIKGRRKSENDFNAYLNGRIDTLTINNYDYKNIKLNGLFAYEKFDGDFLLDDPNGQVGFNGKIDLSGEVPNYSFNAQLTDIRLDKLNLSDRFTNSSLTADLKTDISGKDINDIVGFVHVNDAVYLADEHNVKIDSLLVLLIREGERKRIVLQSDVAEGDLVGTYNFTHLSNVLKQNFLDHLPAFASKIEVNDHEIKHNDFNFSCTFKKVGDIAALLVPELELSDNGLFLGNYNSETDELDVELSMQHLNYKGVKALNPEVHVVNNNDNKLSVVTRVGDLNINDVTSFKNLSFHHKAFNDTVQFNVFWNNWDEYTNSGSILTTTVLKGRNNGVYSTTSLHPSYIMVRDSLWEIQPTTLHYHPDGFSMKNFRVHHANQEIGINGFAHKNIKDGIKIHLQNISLSDMVGYRDLKRVEVSGALNGMLEVQSLYSEPIFSGNLNVNDFVFNDDEIGDFNINAEYLPQNNQIKINSSVTKNGETPLSGGGIVDLSNRQLYLNYDIDRLEIGFLNLYLSRIMQNLSGTASGQLAVAGPLSGPSLIGGLKINKAFFDVGLLKTTYSMTDSVLFQPNVMEFKQIKLSDRNGKQGVFNGTIEHSAFRNMRYNLNLITNDMLVLDTKFADNPLYYGEVYADGNMSVTGTTKDLMIDIAGKTKENTEFFIPLRDEESAEESNFIRFINTADPNTSQLKKQALVNNEYDIDLTGMNVNMELDITPDARCQVIFDSTVGDILRGRGNGNLQIKMDKEGGINFFGDFNFDDGDYMFTLQNVLNKKFVINQGSLIHWDGNPYDANIDLNATYKLKASLNDLVEVGNEDYNRRIPVNCNLLLTDRLTKPNVKFEIKTPSDQDNNQNVIDAYINTEEETNRQVLSLLVLNRFYSQNTSDQSGNRGAVGNNAALVTTTEMLSNQLSHWLSQISRDIDIGVSYRPASELSDDEVEVALSTQMFNNRVIVNGNVGYGQDQTRPSNLIGDFDVEVKLNKSGSLRAKAYTRTNNDLIYVSQSGSLTTQGVGVSFTEDFDSLEELMHKYWMKITGRKEEKEESKEEGETKD